MKIQNGCFFFANVNHTFCESFFCWVFVNQRRRRQRRHQLYHFFSIWLAFFEIVFRFDSFSLGVFIQQHYCHRQLKSKIIVISSELKTLWLIFFSFKIHNQYLVANTMNSRQNFARFDTLRYRKQRRREK